MVQDSSKKPSDKWYYTVFTNAKGYQYIYAYQTKWDPVKKQPRRSAKKYVGRLNDDDSVSIGASFRAAFPQFAEGTFFYGANKQLVDEATYRADFPEAPGPKPCAHEVELMDDVEVGLTWAAEQTAKRAKLLDDLQKVFGDDDGRLLLNLAVYLLADAGSMDCYGVWRQGVYLSEGGVVDGRRISELFQRVTQAKIDKYFSTRHKAKLSKTGQGNVHYALDSTSISTYSRTIQTAAWGHAKRDLDLQQINYVFVCDQSDGEIAYAYAYDGSINDVSSLHYVIGRLTSAEFQTQDIVFVTDRGYSSILNVQKSLDLELRFVQGVYVSEDAIKQSFDRYADSLRDLRFYNSKLDVYARTLQEPWTQSCKGGAAPVKVWLHLYRFPSTDETTRVQLAAQADRLLECKAKGVRIDDNDWRRYARYIKLIEPKTGEPFWQRNNEAIEQTAKYAGAFVVRSNEVADPFAALSIYNLRNKVEFDFNQFKNWVEGDRVRCTDSGYLGKIFVCTLATCIRLMMMRKAQSNESKDLKIPGDSLDQLFRHLKHIRADRRPRAAAWVMRQMSKKQRDMLTLLGFDKLPKVLH